jgi:hypothetical protein
MIYLCLVLFLLCGWFLPWWGMAFLSFGLGLLLPERTWKVVLAAGIAWAALAYVLDGRSHGMISQRMAGLFGLPSPLLLLLLMGMIGAVTAGLCFKSGSLFRQARR